MGRVFVGYGVGAFKVFRVGALGVVVFWRGGLMGGG